MSIERLFPEDGLLCDAFTFQKELSTENSSLPSDSESAPCSYHN